MVISVTGNLTIKGCNQNYIISFYHSEETSEMGLFLKAISVLTGKILVLVAAVQF